MHWGGEGGKNRFSLFAWGQWPIFWLFQAKVLPHDFSRKDGQQISTVNDSKQYASVARAFHNIYF
jgi:hypothetical protein